MVYTRIYIPIIDEICVVWYRTHIYHLPAYLYLQSIYLSCDVLPARDFYIYKNHHSINCPHLRFVLFRSRRKRLKKSVNAAALNSVLISGDKIRTRRAIILYFTYSTLLACLFYTYLGTLRVCTARLSTESPIRGSKSYLSRSPFAVVIDMFIVMVADVIVVVIPTQGGVKETGELSITPP